MPAEASGTPAKFDGMRFGLRVVPEDSPTAESVMKATRGAGFGQEAKRRILLGTYALSAGYYDAYYGSAQKVRTLVQGDFSAAFDQVDVLASPTSPTVAFRLGEKIDDPLAMYLNDIATIPANLAGVPGISVPSGLAEDGLPAGIQFLAPTRADERLDRKSTRLNYSHVSTSYAVFCLKKKKMNHKEVHGHEDAAYTDHRTTSPSLTPLAHAAGDTYCATIDDA